MSFPTRYCVWENGTQSCWVLEETRFSGIQKQITSANRMELMENPWSSSGRSSQDSETAGILNEIQKMMGELQSDPADFNGRIIFMSMFNDIVRDAKGNEPLLFWTRSKERPMTARKSSSVFFNSFLNYFHIKANLNECWDRTAEKMMQHFQRSGHPILSCTSALERGQLRSKWWGRTTIHVTASDDNVQMLLKMVISVNQLSLYGADADLIK